MPLGAMGVLVPRGVRQAGKVESLKWYGRTSRHDLKDRTRSSTSPTCARGGHAGGFCFLFRRSASAASVLAAAPNASRTRSVLLRSVDAPTILSQNREPLPQFRTEAQLAGLFTPYFRASPLERIMTRAVSQSIRAQTSSPFELEGALAVGTGG